MSLLRLQQLGKVTLATIVRGAAAVAAIDRECLKRKRYAGYEHCKMKMSMKRLSLVANYIYTALTNGLLISHHMHLGQHLSSDQRLVNLDERLVAIGSNPGDLLAIAGSQTTRR